MTKPACPKCGLFFRPKQNGHSWVECYPVNSDVPAGAMFDGWRPYKLWQGDLWECRGCLAEIIVGSGHQPISEKHFPGFDDTLRDFAPTTYINDC